MTISTPQSLEIEIDAQLAAAAGKTTEIARVQTAVDQMTVELAEFDSRILVADEQAAKLELQARLDGTKAPKPSAEGDALHGAHRRLSAAIVAAKGMQTVLAAERDEAIATATLLAKTIANNEFEEQSKRVAAAWAAYAVAFSEYSASAFASGQPFGWNGGATFGDEGLKYEAVEGQRIRVLDYDQQVYQAAIGRSNGQRVMARIDAARLP